jgi:hypothetical protein
VCMDLDRYALIVDDCFHKKYLFLLPHMSPTPTYVYVVLASRTSVQIIALPLNG